MADKQDEESMNITEATKKACEEPTLLEALTWICVWDSERVVKQARANAQWGTCFKVCLKSVLDNYKQKVAIVGGNAEREFVKAIAEANERERLDKPDREKGEELVEKCMPALERFEEIEKQVFYPIPKPVEFSSTIRIYASTMSREAVRKTIALIPDIEEAQKKVDDWQVGFEHFLSSNLGLMQKMVEEAKKQVKICILQAIADEPEYPSNMPDELWDELDGNRDKTEKAMQSTVRLTKNGITDRFLQALKGEKNGNQAKTGITEETGHQEPD